MDSPPLVGGRIALEQAHEQRRLDRTRTKGVHAHTAAGELDRQLAGEREDRALRGRIGDLRGRGAPGAGDDGNLAVEPAQARASR
jgi:hypothetical protein